MGQGREVPDLGVGAPGRGLYVGAVLEPPQQRQDLGPDRGGVACWWGRVSWARRWVVSLPLTVRTVAMGMSAVAR